MVDVLDAFVTESMSVLLAGLFLFFVYFLFVTADSVAP